MTYPTIIFFLCIVQFCGLCIFAAVNDVLYFKLPNKVILLIATLFIPVALVNYDMDTLLAHSLIGASVLLISFILFMFNLFGAGDAKFLAAVALWAGPKEIMTLLIVMGLVGGVLALFHTVRARYSLIYTFSFLNNQKIDETIEKVEIPYGVAIAAGALVTTGFQVMTYLESTSQMVGG